MSNPFDLTGKNALITGGGRGIGREVARTLANAGANIAIAEILPEIGEEAVSEMKEIGRDSIFIETDVRSSESCDNMAKAAIDHFGQIDILINNAGIARNTPAEETPDEEWLEVININLNGVFYCSRAVGKHMLERGSGSIVSIASMSGSIVNKPQPQAAYNTAKAGVIMLTKSLAAEWAQRGVRVNCVSPGYTATEMTKRGASNAEWYKFWIEMTPMARMGEPNEIANCVWFLASDASPFVTGADLIVDGGYVTW